MGNQPSRDVQYAAGSIYIHDRTVIFDCIDDDGPVTIGVVDEEVLASDIARVVAGLAQLAGDHAELAELHAAHTRQHPDDTAADELPEHDPRMATTLVPQHPIPAVPLGLLLTPAERAAARLPQLPPRPAREAIEYRDVPVAHHGGQYVAPGRRVVTGTWRYPSPEVCQDDRRTGVWIGPPDRTSERALVCISCGLDGT